MKINTAEQSLLGDRFNLHGYSSFNSSSSSSVFIIYHEIEPIKEIWVHWLACPQNATYFMLEQTFDALSSFPDAGHGTPVAVTLLPLRSAGRPGQHQLRGPLLFRPIHHASTFHVPVRERSRAATRIIAMEF